MLDVFNIFEFLIKMFEPLIALSQGLYNWLLSDVTILGYSFTPIYITAPIIIALMIWHVVR